MSKVNKAFGRVLRNLREQKGWSQLDLEVKLESSAKYISDLELGKRNVGLLYADKVARVFGITLVELFELMDKEL